jgi:alanine dehydrogenase
VLTLGVLKETKVAERRVALVPTDTGRLIEAGVRAVIQAGAGLRAGFSDDQYRAIGAAVMETPNEVISHSDVVIKVKEPALTEIEQLRSDQLFMSFLHLAAYPDLIAPLRRSRATALGYETIAEENGHPVLRPMSEIAGSLALQIGQHYLEATNGGRGVLLPGIHGKDPGKIVIVGSGIVGEASGRLAYGEGIRVVFVDASRGRLKELAERYPNATTLEADPSRLSAELADTDLLVGAVYVNGARAPRVVSRAQIARMPAGSVAVDVAIDQGGCFETSRPTTHAKPVYQDSGVLHYCVTNIPAMVPHSASIALSAALTPYLVEIVETGIDRALTEKASLAGAINIRAGRVVLPALAELKPAA